MILATTSVIPRYTPAVRDSSRSAATATPVEPLQPSGQEIENLAQASPLATDRVKPGNETESRLQTRNTNRPNAESQLSEEDRSVLEQLKTRDREVRAHEAAHLAAAGSHATSGASFTYQRGPDGQLYAIGGEVGVDISKVTGDPQATLEKAQQVRAAALAPASPSSQDRAIAARASQLAAEARREITVESVEASRPAASAQTPADKAGPDAEVTPAHAPAEQVYAAVASAGNEPGSRLLDIHV